MTTMNPTASNQNHFKRGLAQGTQQAGLWLTLESPNATEALASIGYAWLLLDMEHTCVDVSQVVDHLRAARGGTAELVVRIPSNDPILVKRLLDAGVRSIMVPFVQSAAEARQVVAATRYPPHGIRGVAGMTRATGFSRIKDYGVRYAEEQCILVQIESPVAVEAIPEIGAVEGIDGIFVGPNDLAANMGLYGQPGAPEVRATITSAANAIRATGKAAGILNFHPTEARELLREGYDFVAVGSDLSILVRRGDALLAEVTGR